MIYYNSKLNEEEVSLLNKLKSKVMGSYEKDIGINKESIYSYKIEIEEKFIKK
jgi:hypothetical protein